MAVVHLWPQKFAPPPALLAVTEPTYQIEPMYQPVPGEAVALAADDLPVDLEPAQAPKCAVEEAAAPAAPDGASTAENFGLDGRRCSGHDPHCHRVFLVDPAHKPNPVQNSMDRTPG